VAELSRKGVVDEAIRLADEHGLAAVTFRAVAERLGVHFTSIRHYVSTKDELLDAMADALLEQTAKLPSNADWRQVFRALGNGTRQVSERHPGAVAVLTQRAAAGPNALDVVETCLAALERGGFTRRRAAMALAAFNSMVIGLTVEVLGSGNGQEDPVVDPATHPHVARLAGTEIRHWDFAVNALIAGLASSEGA
jgi:AcrR family transcriptional regulator